MFYDGASVKRCFIDSMCRRCWLKGWLTCCHKPTSIAHRLIARVGGTRGLFLRLAHSSRCVRLTVLLSGSTTACGPPWMHRPHYTPPHDCHGTCVSVLLSAYLPCLVLAEVHSIIGFHWIQSSIDGVRCTRVRWEIPCAHLPSDKRAGFVYAIAQRRTLITLLGLTF